MVFTSSSPRELILHLYCVISSSVIATSEESGAFASIMLQKYKSVLFSLFDSIRFDSI